MIQAKIQTENNISKPLMAAVKNDLANFHKNYNNYWKIDMQPNYIIFILPSYNLIEAARNNAERLIESMGLELEVVGTGQRSTTFIVKQKGDVE